MANIILLEDNFKLLKLYTKLLFHAGHRVTPVATVQAASDLVHRRSFDIYISDLQVGLVEPLRVIEALGRIQKRMGIPVIVMSAHTEKYYDYCQQHGLMTVLSKPVMKDDLISAVADRLQQVTSFEDETEAILD